jgi:CheY-like chemotaxis protein
MSTASAIGTLPSRPLALIVDDSPFLAAHLSRLLLALGLDARIPADAEELRALAPAAAVILVELELFYASGFEVTRELAAQCSCPLVLLTGTGRKTDLQWGVRAGAGAVLRRPVTETSLQIALTRVGCTGFNKEPGNDSANAFGEGFAEALRSQFGKGLRQ